MPIYIPKPEIEITINDSKKNGTNAKRLTPESIPKEGRSIADTIVSNSIMEDVISIMIPAVLLFSCISNIFILKEYPYLASESIV